MRRQTHGLQKTQLHGGWSAFGPTERERLTACAVCGGPLPSGAPITRRYCSQRCASAGRRATRAARIELTGGSKQSYSVIVSGENERGQSYTVVGWGQGRRAAREDAVAQLARLGFEPICFSTPDSILADLQKSAPA